jgi:DNA-binding response OmpR family regulator
MTKKILLVEDSITQALKTKLSLTNKGYIVDIATDGERGVALAAQFRPNVVVLDMNLPKLSGLEVCKILKNDAAMRSTTIIMFSEEDRLKTINGAYEVGADYYIAKSENAEELLTSVIETFFARKSASLRRLPAEPSL